MLNVLKFQKQFYLLCNLMKKGGKNPPFCHHENYYYFTTSFINFCPPKIADKLVKWF